VIVPALAGLGAPHWQPNARAAITGLTFATGRAQIVRAALEAMAHQTHDLMRAFEADGAAWQSLKIDGGMSANNWLARIWRTARRAGRAAPTRRDHRLGAAMLAAVAAACFSSLEQASAMRGPVSSLRASPHGARGAGEPRHDGWRARLRHGAARR
jgi:glycerol kinase